MQPQRNYGYIRDDEDPRDKHFAFKASHLPKAIDLRPRMTAAYDQGPLGSCVGNGVARAVEFSMARQGLPPFRPSRLFIYYNGRVLRDTVMQDSGLQIRDGIKSVNRWGVCAESSWPYDIAKFTQRPRSVCYRTGKTNRILKYHRVEQTATGLKSVLAGGWPIVFGFQVFDGFEEDRCSRTGVLQMPQRGERVLGGHCVAAAGYDEYDNLICANSYGATWGNKGFFTMPMEYAVNSTLASDFWVIT
jgi:C1A family cysteine protease